MPYKIRKLPLQNKYKVYNDSTKQVHSFSTTKESAVRQVRLLNSLLKKR